jgi:hypothetical protein
VRWQSALVDADLFHEKVPEYAFVVVAAVLVKFADADGCNCRPSVETIARKGHISVHTVRRVLTGLVEQGWLNVTRVASQQRPTTYRLVIPDLPREVPLEDSQTYPVRDLCDEPEVPPGLPPDLPGEVPDLLPPSTKYEGGKEREVAALRCADAPLAPPSTPESEIVIDEDMVRLAKAIASGADMPLDPGRRGLGRELVEAKARAGWDDEQLVRFCVDALTRPKKVDKPTGFLAHHLRTQATATTQQPHARVAQPEQAKPTARQAKEPKPKPTSRKQEQLEAELAKMAEAVALLEAANLNLGHDGPLPRLRWALWNADLIDDGYLLCEVPSTQSIEPAHVNQWLAAVREANRATEPYLEQARELIAHEKGNR